MRRIFWSRSEVVNEIIGIEAGHSGQSEHFAVIGIERDDRPSLDQGLFQDFSRFGLGIEPRRCNHPAFFRFESGEIRKIAGVRRKETSESFARAMGSLPPGNSRRQLPFRSTSKIFFP